MAEQFITTGQTHPVAPKAASGGVATEITPNFYEQLIYRYYKCSSTIYGDYKNI